MRWAIIALASMIYACGGEPPACEASLVRLALTNGSVVAQYLGLSEQQSAAVVRVELGLDGIPGGERCSGVLIAPGWVLTAAHCAHGASEPSVSVHFGAGDEAPRIAASAIVHEELDLMLLELERDVADGPVPIAIAETEAGGVGDLVQVAGFGRDASGASGARQFGVAELIETSEQDLVVSAGGLGGACFGDSGGPALMRDGDGRVVVLGVLSEGAVSCFGRDRYARASAALDWIREHVGTAEELEQGVASLGHAGRCFGAVAVWVEDAATRSEPCDDRACGWSAREAGFRCVDAASDPCEGIGELGVCSGDVASWCVDGALVRHACDECAARCARSPKTGRAICVGE